MSQPTRHLGLFSGAGLVVSNMVGAGVFLSAGFMAQDLGPGTILAAWLLGSLIALAGVRCYATVARWVPRSGGEYRYLTELAHPALGYLAGWASLLVGFSAPVAVNAFAAGSFVAIFVPGGDPRLIGTLWIVVLTAFHAVGLRSSRVTQNALVVLDVLLLLGFVAAGLSFGERSWPAWTPPVVHEGFPTQAFVQSLFFIAFAFAGWNASAYVAGEFRDPERDAPRAMLLGTGGVAILYLIVNWVFVANLTPGQARAVFEYEQSRVTLGHLVMTELIGPAAGTAMSLLVICAFTASTSAMTFAGPRVYAEMARDGFLPRALVGQQGKPPVFSVLLQSSLALIILYTHTLREALANVGAILTLFTALVCASLFRVWWRPGALKPPDGLTLVAAAIQVAMAVYMLWFGLRGQTGLLGWVAGVAGVALVAYFLSPHRADRQRAGRDRSRL